MSTQESKLNSQANVVSKFANYFKFSSKEQAVKLQNFTGGHYFLGYVDFSVYIPLAEEECEVSWLILNEHLRK